MTTPARRSGLISSEEADRIRNEAAEINRRYQRHLPRHARQRMAGPSEREAKANQKLAAATKLRKQQRWAEALSLAEAARGIAPLGSMAQADAYALMGDVQLEQGNYQASRATYEQTLQIAPAHFGAHQGLAAAYRRSRHPEDAVPLYLEAIALTDSDSQRRHLRGLLAETYREMGKADLARELLMTTSPPAESTTLQTLLLPASTHGWLRWIIGVIAAFALWRSDHLWMALFAIALALLWPLLRIGWARLRNAPTTPHNETR